MTPDEIRDFAITVLDDMKGIDITPIDVRSLTDITDYMIICTGSSGRHVRALAETMVTKAKKLGHITIEGDENSEWVLVDLGDVVVHVMVAATRSFYSLEDLWEPIKESRDNHA